MKDLFCKVALFSAILPFVCACGDRPQKKRPAVPVRVTVVTTEMSGARYGYTGTIQEYTASSLSFLSAGTVRQVYTDVGRSVVKGQRLAVLDEASFRDAHAVAAADLEKAEDAYRRMKMLHDAGSLPDMKWVEVQSALSQARGMERIARKNLQDAVLYAPSAGMIAQRYIDPGVNVAPGAPVFRLVEVDKVYAVVSVPEKDIPALETGMSASVKVGALGDALFSGTLAEKGVVADPLSHTYQVKIELDNPSGVLMPGMVCSVDILSGAESPQIVLPPSVVQIDDRGHSFVWLAREGRADKRIVVPGALTGYGVVIAQGLADGDAVIVEGGQKVSQGMEIAVQ